MHHNNEDKPEEDFAQLGSVSDETVKAQTEKGIEHIKRRMCELAKRWHDYTAKSVEDLPLTSTYYEMIHSDENLFKEMQEQFDLQFIVENYSFLLEIAVEFADLENDFAYIKETAEFTARRYEEFAAHLPTLQEFDLLLDAVKNKEATDKEFFAIESKELRVQKLTKMRSAIKSLQR